MEASALGVRVSAHENVRFTTDYTLLERAVPFTGRMTRSAFTILLEGRGRFDERDTRSWLEPGSIAVSDQRVCGTEAYAGDRTLLISMEWDPAILGAPIRGSMKTFDVDPRDRPRFVAIAERLFGERPEDALVDLVSLMRANGLPFSPLAAADLVDRSTPGDRRLAAAIDARLSRLDQLPSIEEVSTELGWTPRHVNRRVAAIARDLAIPWPHWRTLLHHSRMLNAMRLVSVAGATTELVARLTGFRSPNALCHAFAKAGLPSPGVMARAARVDVLETWTAYGSRPIPVAAE